MKKIKAYTLMEIMVVVILVGVMAAFAIPNFTTAVKKAKIRDAVAQLTVLNAANAVYFAQNGDRYLDGTNLAIASINSGLNINLIANGLVYSYSSNTTTNTTYQATAADGSNFTVRVNQNVISSSIPNPCCSAGTCESIVPAC